MIRNISDAGGISVVTIERAVAAEEKGKLLGLRSVLKRKLGWACDRVHIFELFGLLL